MCVRSKYLVSWQYFRVVKSHNQHVFDRFFVLAGRACRVWGRPQWTWASPGPPWSARACWVQARGRPWQTGATRVRLCQPCNDRNAGRVSESRRPALVQVKKGHRLWEACAAPWPPSSATSLWPAWSLTSVWPVLQQRSAAPAWRPHRALRQFSAAVIRWRDDWLGPHRCQLYVFTSSDVFLSEMRRSRCDVHRQQFLISFVIHFLLSSPFLMCVPSALPPSCGFYWITILFSGKEHFNVQPPVWSSAVPERLLLFSPLNVLMQYIKSALSRSIETINNSYLLQTYIRCLYLFALKSFVGNKTSTCWKQWDFYCRSWTVVVANHIWSQWNWISKEDLYSDVGKVNLTGHFLSLSSLHMLAGEVDWKC